MGGHVQEKRGHVVVNFLALGYRRHGAASSETINAIPHTEYAYYH
jgi:hypothetical protein